MTTQFFQVLVDIKTGVMWLRYALIVAIHLTNYRLLRGRALLQPAHDCISGLPFARDTKVFGCPLSSGISGRFLWSKTGEASSYFCYDLQNHMA